MGLYLALNLSKRWKVFLSWGRRAGHPRPLACSRPGPPTPAAGTDRVHVEGVHAQVVGREVHALEDLTQCLLAALLHVHDLLQVPLHRPLDEAQQVLLVHAGRGVDVRVHLGRAGAAGAGRLGGPRARAAGWSGLSYLVLEGGGWAELGPGPSEDPPTFRML